MGHPQLRASLSLQGLDEPLLSSGGCLSCLSSLGRWKLSSEWWPVCKKVLIQLINHFPAETYAVKKYHIYSKEEKQQTQISAGSSENKWFYLHFSRAASYFCFILRLSIQNVQNKSSTEGDAGEGPSAARCLWKAERVGKLSTGGVLLTCSQKVCLFIGILGCSWL